MWDINATKCAKTKIREPPVMAIEFAIRLTEFEPDQYISTEICSNLFNQLKLN